MIASLFPVMTMFMLNEVTPLMLSETLSVNTAEVDCPAFSDAPSLSQVTAICPAAPAGLHAPVDMFKVIGTFPVFFT
jgi:hypothetical protein